MWFQINICIKRFGKSADCQQQIISEMKRLQYTRAHTWTSVTRYKQRVTGCGSQQKQCSCYSTESNVNSMILILKFYLTSLRNIYIKSGHRLAPHIFLCTSVIMFLNEVKFNLRMRITLFIWVFVKNHNLWRFDCTQWVWLILACRRSSIYNCGGHLFEL